MSERHLFSGRVLRCVFLRFRWLSLFKTDCMRGVYSLIQFVKNAGWRTAFLIVYNNLFFCRMQTLFIQTHFLFAST